MVNSITQSNCVHCGATWQTGCVIKTICRVCEANGHTDGLFKKCLKCTPPTLPPTGNKELDDELNDIWTGNKRKKAA